ncbi:MAG: hypothetical protein ACLU9S_18160 [Oscillospiraceae bacterium]
MGATDSVTLEHVTVGDTVKIYTQSAGEFALIGEKVAEDATSSLLENRWFPARQRAGRICYTTTQPRSPSRESAEAGRFPSGRRRRRSLEPAMQVSFEEVFPSGFLRLLPTVAIFTPP